MSFERVDRATFDDVLATSGSRLFRRYNFAANPAPPEDYVIHRGSISDVSFRVPAFNTLIIGDLTIDGLLDLGDPDGFEEGGVFIVLGNVVCASFSTGYGKGTAIDGNLEADSLLLNAFEDSGLIVTGHLRTYFFYGRDIWAEVGGTAEMNYGDGYCLPIGYTNAAAQAVEPRHDRASSLGMLRFGNMEERIEPYHFLDRLRAGQPIFK